MAAGGRLTLLLVVDGALSMAFVPAFVVLAFIVVLRTGTRRQMPLPESVDRFMCGNTPWLAALIGLYAVTAFVPPRGLSSWLLTLGAMALAALGWSLRLDYRFFRDATSRSRGGALRDLVLHRAMSWTGIFVYFLGWAAWTEYGREAARWLGR
jgi:hypothetical protein